MLYAIVGGARQPFQEICLILERNLFKSLMMLLSDFSFEYPSDLIAQEAIEPRGASRMIVLNRKDQSIQHFLFQNIPEFFKKGDVLVLNDTKVLPARLWAKKKTGGKVEVLFVKQIQTGPVPPFPQFRSARGGLAEIISKPRLAFGAQQTRRVCGVNKPPRRATRL